MLSLIFKNKEIWILILIVVGGIYYSIESNNRISLSSPGNIDFHCSGIHVPSEIKFNNMDLFCSCVRMGDISKREERQEYCLGKFSKKD
ncbi:hypothetical protein ACWKWF_08140 [Acinetobacter kookii]